MKQVNWKKWGILAAAALVVLFFANEVVEIVKGEYDTVSAEMSTEYDTVEAQAFVTRDETLLFNPNGGTMVALAKNAEKVAADSTVVGIFSSAKTADYYMQLQYLKQELEGYQRISNQRALENLDIEMLGKQVDADFQDICDDVYSGNYSDVADKKLTFLVDISRRQISLEEQIDCSATLHHVQEQISSLESVAVPLSTVNAGQTGYYMAEADGYESTLPVSSLNSVSVAGVEKLLKAKPEKVPENCIGKIVNGFYWYMAAVVDAKDIGGIESGDKVDIIIGNANSDMVKAEVMHVSRQSDGKTAIVVRCNQMTAEHLAMRMVSIKFVRHVYTGLKVPKTALRKVMGKVKETKENKDGEKETVIVEKLCDCVYVRLGNVTKRRFLNVVYATDSFVIAKDVGIFTSDETHLKNHDTIITNAKGMNE